MFKFSIRPKALAAAFLVASVPAAFAADKSIASAFGPGEQATYSIEYLGIRTASAQITVGAETQQWGKEVWPIVALAKTDSIFSMYPVKDKFVTYWDAKGRQSWGNDLFADEGKKKRRQRIKLDHAGGTAKVMKQKEGEQEQESASEITPGSLDVAAATFAVRNLPLKVGDRFEFPVFTGTKTFTLKGHVEDAQRIETAMGAKDVQKVRVQTAFTGKFESKRDIFVYFTRDEAHIPVRIEAEFLLGTFVAELTDYKQGKQYAAVP